MGDFGRQHRLHPSQLWEFRRHPHREGGRQRRGPKQLVSHRDGELGCSHAVPLDLGHGR